MATVTISAKFQIVIPKQVRGRLCLKLWQRLQIIQKGGSSLWFRKSRLPRSTAHAKGKSKKDLREK